MTSDVAEWGREDGRRDAGFLSEINTESMGNAKMEMSSKGKE